MPNTIEKLESQIEVLEVRIATCSIMARETRSEALARFELKQKAKFERELKDLETEHFLLCAAQA